MQPLEKMVVPREAHLLRLGRVSEHAQFGEGVVCVVVAVMKEALAEQLETIVKRGGCVFEGGSEGDLPV